VTYTDTSDAPNTSARTISFVLNDGAANSTAATKTVSVAAVNDAPVAQNGSASGNEDTVIAGSAVATDVDNTPRS
jgi:hypothetical protein